MRLRLGRINTINLYELSKNQLQNKLKYRWKKDFEDFHTYIYLSSGHQGTEMKVFNLFKIIFKIMTRKNCSALSSEVVMY